MFDRIALGRVEPLDDLLESSLITPAPGRKVLVTYGLGLIRNRLKARPRPGIGRFRHLLIKRGFPILGWGILGKIPFVGRRASVGLLSRALALCVRTRAALAFASLSGLA